MTSYFSCDIPYKYVEEVKKNNYDYLVSFIGKNKVNPNSFNSLGYAFNCISATNCENPNYQEDNPLLLAISCNCFNSVKALIEKGATVVDSPFKTILLKFDNNQINEIIKMNEIQETGLQSIIEDVTLKDVITDKCSFETLFYIYQKSKNLSQGCNKILITHMDTEPEIDRKYETGGIDQKVTLCNFLDICKNREKTMKKSFIDEEYNNTTVLINAVEKGKIEIIKELKDYADPNISVGNTTALIKAIELNKFNIVDILLTFPKIDINVVSGHTNNALINAIKLERYDIVEKLLNMKDINVNIQVGNSETKKTDALLTAIEKNNSKIVNIILSKNSTCSKNIGGTNYLIKAVEVSNVDIVKSLLDSCNSDINVIINEKNALIIALENNKFEIANILLSKITNINSGICEQALNIIRKNEVNNSNETEIKNITTLLSGKSCKQDNSFQNNIETYVQDKDFNKVENFINLNRDKINQRFTDDKTALEIAIKQNDEKLVKLLLDNGADPKGSLHQKFLKDDLVYVKYENNFIKAVITNVNKDNTYNGNYYNKDDGLYNISFSNIDKNEIKHYINLPLHIAKNQNIAMLLKTHGAEPIYYSLENIELYPIWVFDEKDPPINKIQMYIKRTVNNYNKKNKFLRAEIDYIIEKFFMKWCYDLDKGKLKIIKEIDKYINENVKMLSVIENSSVGKLRVLKTALNHEIEPLKQYKIIIEITIIIRSLESKKQPSFISKIPKIMIGTLLYLIVNSYIFPVLTFATTLTKYIGEYAVGVFVSLGILSGVSNNIEIITGVINWILGYIYTMLGYNKKENEFAYLDDDESPIETPKFIVDYIKEYIYSKYTKISKFLTGLFNRKKDGSKHVNRISNNKKSSKKSSKKYSRLRRSKSKSKPRRSKCRSRISKTKHRRSKSTRRRSKSTRRRSKSTHRRSKSKRRRSKSKRRRSKSTRRRSKSTRRRSNKYKLQSFFIKWDT